MSTNELANELKAGIGEILDGKINQEESRAIIDLVFETIGDKMKEAPVAIEGFGVFEVRERAARKGRNPQTGEAIDIKASKAPAFKPRKQLKDKVKA